VKEILKLRRQAAINALNDLNRTLENVRKGYDKKQELKIVLHDNSAAGINRSLVQLTSFLDQIRTNTQNQNDGGHIPAEVETVIKFAETRVKDLTQHVAKARDLTTDLKEFEIDSGAFGERKERLYTRGLTDLKKTSDSLLDLHKIWDEAFALVSGLCLRHEGLDGGLCRIADALIGEINWIGAKVFTLPGRGRPGMVSRIVLLSFPEWTMWALPLAAQGLWHLAVRGSSNDDTRISTGILESMLEVCRERDVALAQELQDSAASVWGNEDFQDCLGDVYGTFSLGPAYACACVCLDLVLDPNSKKSEQRALAIFRTLASMPFFDPVQELLQNRWREVVPVVGKLENVNWIDATLLYLKEMAKEFAIERWKQYRIELTNHMRLGEVEKIEPGQLSFNFLLNAAWKARFDNEEISDKVLDTFMKASDKLLAHLRLRTVRPSALN
jgi:hypothetical protein